ncbi:hypothetical protein [Enterobacter hormaechei]|uniref:hypothetical protein n=1 Tax=Enterobacter hormaechei TaxID=158836 RepID=UPI00294A623A|nr:hypothetical protein [Enterobacter hormaechei]MDV5636798.1 hypothetical protein [Enterobacter hormaechei]
MSNIDKHALIAKIKKQTESFDTVVLKEDEANALLDELEALKLALASLEAESKPRQPELSHVIYHFRDWNEGFPIERFKADYVISWMLANYPPAQPAAVSVPDDVSGPLAHAYKELTPTFMRNHIDVFERYGIYPDGSEGIQAMRIALDGMNRRAAMLQGAENAESPTTMQTAPALDSSPKFADSPSGNSPVIPDCWCRTCRPVVLNDMRFVVCPDCGNKRCPRANDHKNSCTGSNEPGQEGSAYPASPQEVKGE